MTILRVTHFRWGDTINNWYPDWDAVERQLACEDPDKGPDITHTDWYECTLASQRPGGKGPSMTELLSWNKQGGQIE